jgi:hypothetical protein
VSKCGLIGLVWSGWRPGGLLEERLYELFIDFW